MEHPGFFERAGPFALGAVAAAANAKLADGVDPDLALKDVRPLDEAGEGDLSFVDNPKYLPPSRRRARAPASSRPNLPIRHPQPRRAL